MVPQLVTSYCFKNFINVGRLGDTISWGEETLEEQTKISNIEMLFPQLLAGILEKHTKFPVDFLPILTSNCYSTTVFFNGVNCKKQKINTNISKAI